MGSGASPHGSFPVVRTSVMMGMSGCRLISDLAKKKRPTNGNPSAALFQRLPLPAPPKFGAIFSVACEGCGDVTAVEYFAVEIWKSWCSLHKGAEAGTKYHGSRGSDVQKRLAPSHSLALALGKPPLHKACSALSPPLRIS